jgi:hypothetical protein
MPLLGAIAGVSLVVSGIGIMNTSPAFTCELKSANNFAIFPETRLPTYAGGG